MEVVLKDISYKGLLKKTNLKFSTGVTVLIGKSSELIVEILTCLKKDKGKILIDKVPCENAQAVNQQIGYVPYFTSLYLREKDLKINPFEACLSKQQEIKLKLTLESNKQIIILSNPNVGLDEVNTKKLLKEITNLKLNKKTVIIISCDVSFIHQVADYIYLIDEKVIVEGNKYDFFEKEEILKKHKIKIPQIIDFSNYVLQNKKIKLGYRDSIDDLLKDVYRYAK